MRRIDQALRAGGRFLQAGCPSFFPTAKNGIQMKLKPAIANGLAVTLHYRLTLGDGTIVDDTFEGDPLVYVHGSGELVDGLERQLAGMRAGQASTILVEPEDAYGDREAGAEVVSPRSQFPPELDLQPGMMFQAEGPSGAVRVWVQQVEEEEVTVTSNHPLSGERLSFDVKVLGVREADPEKAAAPST